MRMLRIAPLARLSALIVCCLGALAGDTLHLQIRNFYQVNDHLFRGGQPTPDGLRQLAANHVSLVVDLREPSQETENERRLAASLGMRFENIPLSAARAPTPDEMKRILSLIVPDYNSHVFVHCLRGKDRTGTVIACYRIQHDGWTPREALREAESKGMSRAEFAMHSFIMRFKPIDLPPPLAASNK